MTALCYYIFRYRTDIDIRVETIMSYILTRTGKHFDPVAPDEQLLDIYDIAHALSLLCRANGHFTNFYSVAQHSIACAKEAEARGLSSEIVLGCLMHDASEAYISDVTRPIKKELPYYLEMEDRLQEIIWQHFIGRQLSDEEKMKVFEIDDDMLSMEFHLLMSEDLDDRYVKLKRPVSLSFRDFEEVQNEFLEMYEAVAGRL